MRAARHLGLGSLLLLLLLGCGTAISAEVRQSYAELLIEPAACRAPSPEPIEPETLRRDLDLLERLFRRGYAGYELVAEPARWDRAFLEARRDLSHRAIAPDALVDLLAERFAFVDDNHVGFTAILSPGRRRWRSTGGHHQAYVAPPRFADRGEGPRTEEGDRLVRCGDLEASEVLRRVLGADPSLPRYRIIVLSRERLESLSCTFETGDSQEEARELELSAIDIFDHRGPAFERRETAFPWLRVRTLFTDRREALERFVESAEEARAADVVVLDLRRAGGGSDRFLLRWFRGLTDLSLRYWRTEDLESEVTLQGALSFFRCIGVASDADSAGQAWLDRRVQRAQRDLDLAMQRRGIFVDRERESLVLEGFADRPFAGRLILLVDRGCSSACETSVMLARQLPGAIVVGENTGGVMKVGEIRSYRLPGSGLFVSLGTRIHQEPTDAPSFREGLGFLPDLWLDGEDPEGQVEQLARCLADPACRSTVEAFR